MNKLKIALFIPTLAGGGAEKVFLRLAVEFYGRGHDVELVLINKKGPYLKDVPKEIKIVDLKAGRALFSIRKLTEYVKKNQPDVMLSAMPHCNLVAAWAKMLTKEKFTLFLTERNYFSLSNKKEKIHKRVMYPLLIKWFYPRSDKIIALSEEMRKDLVDNLKIPEQKTKTIYNPVVDKSIEKKAGEKVEHPFYKEKKSRIIIGVGRLTEQKNFPVLVKAFNKINQKQKNTRLIILGEGEERQNLERLIQKLDIKEKVSLPGFVDNPYKYMAQADVFVLSSLWEGLPGVLIEALACGTQVVSTDCKSGPREILQEGKYGRLVPMNDKLALAKAIKETLDAPVDNDMIKTRTKDFRVEKITEKYLDVMGVN